MALYSKNVGELRLHPQDAHLTRGVGVCAVTGGDVDLSKVSVGKLVRRVEREDAPALKARIKRESRHQGRSARRRAARKAAAATL